MRIQQKLNETRQNVTKWNGTRLNELEQYKNQIKCYRIALCIVSVWFLAEYDEIEGHCIERNLKHYLTHTVGNVGRYVLRLFFFTTTVCNVCQCLANVVKYMYVGSVVYVG